MCPLDTFDDTPLYLEGMAPDAAEMAERIGRYWTPYQEQLGAELARLRQTHGIAMLWDAHSIRSVLPRFFEGRLTDFNLGTADGASCDPALASTLLGIAQAIPGHSAVLNGRFKGGYITRQYGRPAGGIQAVQLELTQCSYMQESGAFDFMPECAERIQPHLRLLLEAVLAYSRHRA